MFAPGDKYLPTQTVLGQILGQNLVFLFNNDKRDWYSRFNVW